MVVLSSLMITNMPKIRNTNAFKAAELFFDYKQKKPETQYNYLKIWWLGNLIISD